MPTIELEPLPADGAFCAETHPTAKSLRCAKRPHAEGAHVALHRDGLLWWGDLAEEHRIGARKLPGFSESPRFSADFSRETARPARVLRDARPARRADLDPSLTATEAGAILPGLTPPPGPSGELCGVCGSASMVRTGKCLTCIDCGSSDGGCS